MHFKNPQECPLKFLIKDDVKCTYWTGAFEMKCRNCNTPRQFFSRSLVLSTHSFAFCSFSYLKLNIVSTYQTENSRNKQSTSFKLQTILSNVMAPCISLFYPGQDMNCSFVWCIHPVYATHPLISGLLVSRWTATVLFCLCSSNTYFTEYGT